MRQLKNFMKAKKPMWRCGECECVTLKCWRENDTFCNCGTSSEGLGVEYAFKNWNGAILKKWSIDEWATPKAPANPTREATAEYTYTFAGWDPEVGPISEDTVYTATYTSTVNQYTVSIAPNDVSYGTVDENSITVDYGTAISAEGNVLTIWTEHITATAETGYVFSSWGTLPETVTENLSITATFETEVEPTWPITITFNVVDESDSGASVSPSTATIPAWATGIRFSSTSWRTPDMITIEWDELEPDEEQTVDLSGWLYEYRHFEGVPSTIVEDVTIDVVFTEEPFTPY